jgi:SAM-dependent methyltransferase
LPRLVSSASGLVVELGPATGNSLQYYSPQRVTQVFGVEPNPDFVVPLRKRLSEVGRDLEEKYTLIVSGIEDTKVLNYYAVVEESIDTVVCMQVLCCVKNRPEVVRKAWELLKPGGMLVFWEHNESSDWLTRNMQGRFCISVSS